jgi:hypothetical protein
MLLFSEFLKIKYIFYYGEIQSKKTVEILKKNGLFKRKTLALFFWCGICLSLSCSVEMDRNS